MPNNGRNGNGGADKPALKRVLEFKAWYGTLPFIYHGFVRRSTLDRIRQLHGALFKRLAPDVYADLLLATFLERFLVLSECLSVGGQGARSSGATFRLDHREADRIINELPEILKPVLSPKSITLQLYEYGLMLRRFWPQDFIVVPSWWRFTAQTCLEAVRYPDHREEIMRDLQRLTREVFPPLTGFVARLLISLACFPPLMFTLAYLLEKRQRQQITEWEAVGAKRGVENVYAAAKFVHEASRSKHPVHQADCLPVA